MTPRDQGAIAPKVLLTSTYRWPSSALLAISLSKAGCDVSAVCPTRGHPLLYARAVHEAFPYRSLRPLESLVQAIEASAPDVIVPSDDRAVQHLHELFACTNGGIRTGSEVRTLIERSLGLPASYSIAASRNDLLSIARQEGLRTPDTKLVTSADDLKSWKEDHALPWVLKADGTFGGRGVKIANTPVQAERLLIELSEMFKATRAMKRTILNRDPFWIRPWWMNYRPSVIVQAYIQGRPANCAVVCWNGKVLAGIAVEVVNSEGPTGAANIVRVVENPDMMLAAEILARRLGLSGFFGLDFMIEDGTGETFLIEMNPRSTPLCHLQLGKGRDLAGALWAQLSGQPMRDIPPVTQNRMIAYFPKALQCKSEILNSSYQDIPEGEPALVQELLRPWPERSLLFRLGHILTTPVAKSKSSPQAR